MRVLRFPLFPLLHHPSLPHRPPAAALDRDRNNFSPEELTRTRRRRRYDLWAGVARVTDLKSLRKCGRAVQHDANGVGVRIAAREDGSAVAGFSHLYRCGSVWSCPRCAPKVAHSRAEDLADLLKAATERGCSGTLVTFTIGHHWGQRLDDCWGAVTAGWHAVTSGKQWRSDEAAYGFVLVDGHPYVPPDGGRKCADCGRSRGEHEERIPWVSGGRDPRSPRTAGSACSRLLLWKGDGDDPAVKVAATGVPAVAAGSPAQGVRLLGEGVRYPRREAAAGEHASRVLARSSRTR